MAELFVLGATGYVGSELVRVALARKHRVRALVRAEDSAARLEKLGVQVTRGDAAELRSVVARAARASAIVDLLQPPLPRRFTQAQAARMAAYRANLTEQLLAGLASLPAAERPLLLSVSGVEDLAPDEQGVLSQRSALRKEPIAFGRIGIPIGQRIAASGLDATYVHFGTVYGPGKAFAAQIVPGIAKGRMPVVGNGDNRGPLTSLTDAARALVHLIEQPRDAVKGKHFLATDGVPTTQRQFLDAIAVALGARRPMQMPLWLAKLALGSVMVEVLTLDAEVDNSALLATGFRLEHPTPREGIADMLAKLGYQAAPAPPRVGAKPPAEHRPHA